MPYTRNGSPQPDTGFTSGDVSYPAGWIAANKSEWSKLNIEEVDEPYVRHYDRKYFWGWSSDGSTLLEKQLEDKDVVDDKGVKQKDSDGNQIVQAGLKTVCKQEQEHAAKVTLEASDWMVVRAAEGGTAVPSEWKTFRSAVRTKCNERQTKIDSVTTTTKLRDLMMAPAQVIKNTLTGEMMENPDPYLPEWPTAPKS